MWLSLFHLKALFWLLCLILATVLCYRKRGTIMFKFRELNARVRRHFGGHIELNDSFVEDLESGLNSRYFDILASNSEDARAGLEEEAKAAIRQIMESQNLSFDKARKVYTERKFAENAIAPDGMPLDPRAVVFSKPTV